MDFLIKLNSSPNELFKILTDFENLPKLLPRQLKNVRILKKEGNTVHTEETMVFRTIIKNEIIQECNHEIEENKMMTRIISGPAKNSVINISFNKVDSGTEVVIKIELKLILKLKIFLPLIKKVYKNLLTGIFYKMDDKVSEENEVYKK